MMRIVEASGDAGQGSVFRIIPCDGLDHHRLRQAHGFSGFELAARNDLAARDPGHVGNDCFDLGDAVFLQKFVDVMHDCSLSFLRGPAQARVAAADAAPWPVLVRIRSRQAAPKA
jgi:hypothetical protein